MNDSGGEETVDAAAAGGGEAVFVHADVSRGAEAAQMVEAAEAKFGRLDILFNNAGISHIDDDDAIHTEESVWDLTMAINVRGVFLGCKYGIPALRRAGGGSIINTASFVAILGAATPQLAYTSSKGAVLAMTRELAAIHARENIRVNALCPGPLRTELLMKISQYRGAPAAAGSYISRWADSVRRKRSQTRLCSWLPTSPPLSPERLYWWMEALRRPIPPRNDALLRDCSVWRGCCSIIL